MMRHPHYDILRDIGFEEDGYNDKGLVVWHPRYGGATLLKDGTTRLWKKDVVVRDEREFAEHGVDF